MRRYETIFIVDPDLSDDQRASIVERPEALITQYQGVLVEREDWGVKKLAYDIRKRTRGYYVRLDYCGEGALVDEMERSFRIDDKVLKFMTIVLDKDVDLEQVKEEMAKAAEAKAAQAETASEAPAETEASDQPAVKAESKPAETETESEEA